MLDNHQANEDLKAFERRLTEIIACYQPQTKRWRILLSVATLSTSISAFNWLFDPRIENVSFVESLHDHMFFTFNCILLIALFLFGIHRKVVAPAILVSRIRTVLENFNMSCDHDGRLILKRATSTLPALSTSSSQQSSTNSTTTTMTPTTAQKNWDALQAMQCSPTIGRT